MRYRLSISRTDGSITNSRFDSLRACFAWLDAIRSTGTVRRAWVTDSDQLSYDHRPTSRQRYGLIIYSR